MESSIWFYTFSTAAQVMAALVGLFAVFVVYKIQDFSELLSDARHALSQLLSYASANTTGYTPVSIEQLYKMSDSDMLMELAGLIDLKKAGAVQVYAEQSVGYVSYKLDDRTYEYFRELVDRKRRIFNRLRYVLILSLGSIAVALCALVFTSFFISMTWFLWLALLLFLYCLWTIGTAVYEITRE